MMAGWRRLVGGLVAWQCAMAASAGDFQRTFEAARRHDPTYRAALQERISIEWGVPIARAALLANASLSLSDARVVGSRTAPNFFGQPVTSDLGYRAPQQSVSVRMPLLNREASQKLQQAEAQAQLAGTQYAARQYELLERVAQAYLQRLYAQDGVRATDAQRVSALELRRQAVRRLELGEGTRPELAQAEADLALAQVQLREARNQVAVAEQALANLMGTAPAAPPQVPADAPLPALQPDTEETWQALAAASSPLVAARRESVAVARLGVERASAGHYPRLDLVASVSSSRNETVSTLNQSATQKSLGLQFNLPLYAGGGVEASVSQAVAQQAKAQAELDAELLDLQADIRRQFLFAQNGQDRLDAARQARDAQALAVQAARMAQVRGMGTATDVLRAEGRLADAGRELAKARYDQLLGQLRLMARAGKPVDDILLMLDGALSPP